MAEAYSLKLFLLHAKQEFLHDFFHRQNLLLDVAIAGFEEGEADIAFAAIQALSPDHREASEACFQDIYQMASRSGIDAIIAASRSTQLKNLADDDLVQRLGGMASNLDRAFWTFLYRPQYWEFACVQAPTPSAQQRGRNTREFRVCRPASTTILSRHSRARWGTTSTQ